jgi:hypothetical protein
VKKENQKEIAAYTSQLEKLKQGALRYSEHQFDLYSGLWYHLYFLRVAADELWNEANKNNLKKFVVQLNETKHRVELSYLFLEENHYLRLQDLLRRFGEYKVGKTSLVDLYRGAEAPSPLEVRDMVTHNAELKRKYEELINEVKGDLKNQIRIQ